MEGVQFRLATVLQHQAQGEYKIEVIRQLLVGKPNYNAYQLFKAVDSDNTEFISRQNLKDFLFKYNFYLNDDDAYALIRRYTNTDGFSITYKEFFKTLAFPVVSPIDVSGAVHTTGVAAPYINSLGALEALLAHKMKTEVDVARHMDVMKGLLTDDASSSFYDTFRKVDVNKSGHITIDELQTIMNNNAVAVTRRELQALFRKYDVNNDGKISYLEWLAQLMPSAKFTHTPTKVPSRKAYTIPTPDHYVSPRLMRNNYMSVGSTASAQRRSQGHPFTGSNTGASVQRQEELPVRKLDYSGVARSHKPATYSSPVRSPASESKYSHLSQLPSYTSTPASTAASASSSSSSFSSSSSSSSSSSRTYYSMPAKRSCIVSHCTLPRFSKHGSYCSVHASIYLGDAGYTNNTSIMQSSRASPSRTHYGSPSSSSSSPSSSSPSLSKYSKRTPEQMFEQLRQKLALHQSYTLVHAFEFIDKDNSGFITIDELAAAMANAGYPLATHELAAIMRLFDKDHDGRVSYAEFVSKMMPSDATYSGLVTSSSARHLEAVAHPQRRKSRLLSIGAQLDLAKTLKALLDNDE